MSEISQRISNKIYLKPLFVAVLLPMLFSCKQKFMNDTGHVASMLFIDKNKAHNLKVFSGWMDQMSNADHFTLFVEKYKPSDNVQQELRKLKNKYGSKISIIPDPDENDNENNYVAMRALGGAGTSAMYGEDAFTVTMPEGPFGSKNIYAAQRYASTYHLADKVGVKEFKETCYPFELIPGGNILTIDSHCFIGITFLNEFKKRSGIRNDADVEKHIRKLYNISPKVTIDFIGMPDEYTQPTLYHLDLMLTCTGKNKDGKYLFFIPKIEAMDIPKNSYTLEVYNALEEFAKKADTVFTARFGQNSFVIARPPAFSERYGRYIYSPVNGIADQDKNGKPIYYFPMPKWGKHKPADAARVDAIAIQAEDIFKSEMNGNGRVIAINIPGYMIRSHSQSLHCTAAVLGRD